MVGAGQATQVGQLTGAKILIAGSVMATDKTLHVVARIIGTETSRVLGASVQGRTSDELSPMIEELADEIARTIDERSDELVAKTLSAQDRIAALNDVLGDARRPTVAIDIDERHLGKNVAALPSATEIAMFLTETGFEVIDAKVAGTRTADIIIRGRGVSELATRRQHLISVKARLEVEAIERASDSIIATERQAAVVVDLSEQLAGQAALQHAAAAIAERLLPKLVP